MTERKLVRELMRVGVKTCGPQTPITDIARLLVEHHEESVAVVDHTGHAVGVVGCEELVRAYSRDDREQLVAENIMRDDVPQIPPEIPLAAAAQLMQDMGVRQVFVMHDSDGVTYPAASLTYTHLLRHLAARNDDELKDLGTRAARQAPLDAFLKQRDAARRQSFDQE